jgi:hypothetical protein
MKINFILLPILTLAGSSGLYAMMRVGRKPVRTPVVTRAYSEIAQIKSKYALPKACPSHIPVARLTREQLMTHLKHQELCWKVAKTMQASDVAKQMIKETVLNAAKTSIKPMVAGAVTMNSAHDVGPELFSFACQEAIISLKMAREAVREYQKTQKDIATAQQALAELVAEQKRQMKVPYDIQ